MYYVYCLVFLADYHRRYTGFTEDIRQRLRDHNDGCNSATAPFKPWKLKGYIAFDEKFAALAFERYLKTGSGHAFAKKGFGRLSLPAAAGEMPRRRAPERVPSISPL
ncbi:MAG TPA: GIY-YIG nuclease family protein [Candidatus Didemnitutus sp.]|nr:GIY-YIG nuclease family protein [Candidatus Didemnitutus sp.]